MQQYVATMVSKRKENLGTMVPPEVRAAFDSIVEELPGTAGLKARCIIAGVVLLYEAAPDARKALLSKIASVEQSDDWPQLFPPRAVEADRPRIAAKKSKPPHINRD